MTERQIFEGALEFTSAADRQAFLDKACGNDPALRASIEALLAAHDGASQFLNEPAVEQLRGETAKGLEQTIDRSIDIGTDEETSGPDLSFLQPSTKPGSIGSLGHYEILQVLGQGAFGVVFRAFDEKLHRQVAVKAMNPQLAATSPPRKRFLREARSVAAIKHENIVQIYSVEEQPLPYLVMEFVQGQTLQQKLEGHGPLDVPEILHLGRQMAAGLAAAHALNMIHRDVKPGNILLEQGAEQKVKITDFGLARAADDASMTRTGVIAGTPMYMSPEQAEGRTLDARSDLFSLGSVLYQMATGRPPFRAPNTIAVLRRVVEDTPRPLTEIIAELPPWLEAIVFRLLEKEPENRFQSAKEVADLFAQCQTELQLYGRVTSVASATSPPVSTPVEPSARPAEAKPAVRHNRWLMAAPALIVVLLLTIYLINRAVDRFYSPTAVSVLQGNGNTTQVTAPNTAIRKFTSGEWIDVIPLIEPQQDKWNVAKQTGKNAWRIEQGELAVGGDALSSKLLLPLDSDWPAYECEVEFTRRAGENGLNINLPTSNGECPVVVDPPGFACVHLGNQQRGAKLQVGKQIFTNQRTTVHVEVHRAPNNNDRVSVALNGSTPWDWTGDLNALALPYRENFPQDRRITLWIHRGGDYVFHRIRVKMLDGSVAATVRPVPPPTAPTGPTQSAAVSQADIRKPVEYENAFGMKFVLVPKGKAWLGGSQWKPADREVEFAQDFYLGAHEVTQEQWKLVMPEHRNHFSPQGGGADLVKNLSAAQQRRLPAENMSWNEALLFVERLNALDPQTDWVYRLPTEAEWEYACRGGPIPKGESEFDFYLNVPTNQLLPSQANFKHNQGLERTCEVGSYVPNRLGLHDMHGNVWEWCWDEDLSLPNLPQRAMRGGSWSRAAWITRDRYARPTYYRNHDLGLRVARVSSSAPPLASKSLPKDLKAPAAAESLDTYFARNRLAAERALARGGEVMIEIPNKEWQQLSAGQSLPADPFVVRMWSVKNSTTVTNDDLDVLAGLRHIQPLNLTAKGRLNADIIPKLAAIRSPLEELGLGHLNLKTSEIDQLPSMPNVHLLWLTADQVDDNWRFLRRFPALRTIELYGSPLPDLSPLGSVPQLRVLRLSDSGEPPTAEQIHDLQTRHPQLRILHHNYATVDKLKLLGADPAQAAARRFIAAGIPVYLTGGHGAHKPLTLEELEKTVAHRYFVPTIPRGIALTEELRGLLTHFDLMHLEVPEQQDADELARALSERQDLLTLSILNSDLTDVGLRDLQKLTGLMILNVSGTQVTAAGVAAYHQNVPECQLLWNTQHLLPAFLTTPLAEPTSAKLQEASNSQSNSASESLESYFARNRQAAERALAVDGEVAVEITKSFEWRTLKPGDSLPAEPFVVRMWSIKNSKTATSSDLDVLAGLRHVHPLNLSAPGRLDAEVIPKIAALRSPVKELSIGHCNLKTSALERLPVMPHVHLLWLTSEQVDDGWRFLKRFPSLRTIEFYGAPIPDLGPLGDVPHLRLVRLVAWGDPPEGAKIRDIQKRNPQLRILYQSADELQVLGNDPGRVAARRLIEAGIPVKFFDAAGMLRQLTLDEVDKTVTMYYHVTEIPRAVTLTDELRGLLTHVNVQAFKAEGQRDADSLAKSLSERPEMDHLTLTDSDLTDEGLRHLSQLSGLRSLYMKGTQVTPAGVAAFHRAVPSCGVQADSGDINPEYQAADR